MAEEERKIEENPETGNKDEPAIEDDMVLIKNPAVTIREEIEEDGNYILFNADNEYILAINPTGKFILENCSGDKTVRQIIRQIKDEFTVKEDMDIASVVKGYISNLLKAELVKIKNECE